MLQLFHPESVPTFQEIQAHFDAHPELWDKNHPEYGKQLRFVDYISSLPLKREPPSEEIRNMYARLREIMAEKNIVIITPKAPPQRNQL